MANVIGAQALQARLHAIGNTSEFMKTLGLRAVREQKLLVRRKTGTTGRTIRLVGSTATTATTEVRAAGPYLEFGTRAHIITPRAAMALRFAAKGVATTLAGRVTKGAARSLGKGAFVFAKIVHHPGTRPYPFMIPGAQKAASEQGVSAIVDVWNSAA